MRTEKIRQAIRYLPESVPLSIKGAALDDLAAIEKLMALVEKAICEHLLGDCGDTRGLRDSLALFEAQS